MKFQSLCVLGIVIVFLLVACGGSATSTAGPTQSSATTPPTDTPRSDPTATTSPTATSNTAVLEIRVAALQTELVNGSLLTIRNIEVGVARAPGEW